MEDGGLHCIQVSLSARQVVLSHRGKHLHHLTVRVEQKLLCSDQSDTEIRTPFPPGYGEEGACSMQFKAASLLVGGASV